jgi:prephenate dehydrogenase
VTPPRVGVIGLGLIGGSIAQRLAGEGAVLGFDSDSEERPGVELAGSAEELARASDLVVVAVPPEHTGATVAVALEANPHALVTDVASVKKPPLDRVRERMPEALDRYLPSHPLAGAESAGWRAARPDLLDRASWAVCPPSPSAGAEPLCRFGALFDTFGARLVVCDAGEHDLAVARTSHAPHLMAAAMAASLDGHRLAAALSGGAFRDMTRVARSDPSLWSEILELNQAEVHAVLDEWLELSKASPSEVWSRGRATVELVEELRWDEPRWAARSFEWPAWDELLALGRDGLAIRRPELEDGLLVAEVAERS